MATTVLLCLTTLTLTVLAGIGWLSGLCNRAGSASASA